jgi:hypothetical protein
MNTIQINMKSLLIVFIVSVFILIYLQFIKLESLESVESIKKAIVFRNESSQNSINSFYNKKSIKRFNAKHLASDGNNEFIKCSSDIEILVNSKNENAAINIAFNQSVISTKSNSSNEFRMVYEMESEPHSIGGDSWINADFRMYYHLDMAFPEPITYFNIKTFLVDLLAHQVVDFNKKNSIPIVWFISNCNAYNGRQVYINSLMKQIEIDSFGNCLKNRNIQLTERMVENVELYSKYKFVIAIENSNCEDYVTEKLVHAVASGALPIVAGRDGKPDYLRFMPKDSYINIYDFSSPEQLVKHLNRIAKNQTEYENYFWYKKRHNYSRDYLKSLSLNQLINLSKRIMGSSERKK